MQLRNFVAIVPEFSPGMKGELVEVKEGDRTLFWLTLDGKTIGRDRDGRFICWPNCLSRYPQKRHWPSFTEFTLQRSQTIGQRLKEKGFVNKGELFEVEIQERYEPPLVCNAILDIGLGWSKYKSGYYTIVDSQLNEVILLDAPHPNKIGDTKLIKNLESQLSDFGVEPILRKIFVERSVETQ